MNTCQYVHHNDNHPSTGVGATNTTVYDFAHEVVSKDLDAKSRDFTIDLLYRI